MAMIVSRRWSLFALHIDWLLFLNILALASAGFFILYSAKQEWELVNRQILHFCLAMGFMFLIAQVPPRVFRWITPWLYFTGLLLVTAVLVVGDISKGGQRWLDLWFIRFQPAELMKLAVPMMVAKYLETQLLPPSFRTLIVPVVLIMLPVILVAKQPDLGTALLILSSGCFGLFFAGLSWKWMIGCGLSITSSLPILWHFLRDYQKQRVLMFLDPTRDPLGAGYQIIQSKIAIGSGGLYGKGWLNGTQAQLEFLPERTTDVIFAVFSEEFGLVGCLILFLLYLCIMIRGLYIGIQAQDTFCRLLSGSLIMAVFVYVFVNIGMVTDVLPVVGVPLPLISYGGTSLVTLMASFGILMSIRTHRTLLGK